MVQESEKEIPDIDKREDKKEQQIANALAGAVDQKCGYVPFCMIIISPESHSASIGRRLKSGSFCLVGPTRPIGHQDTRTISRNYPREIVKSQEDLEALIQDYLGSCLVDLDQIDPTMVNNRKALRACIANLLAYNVSKDACLPLVDSCHVSDIHWNPQPESSWCSDISKRSDIPNPSQKNDCTITKEELEAAIDSCMNLGAIREKLHSISRSLNKWNARLDKCLETSAAECKE